jgi:NADPH:quinone reductase-like Zn-dependent oxidoreductase
VKAFTLDAFGTPPGLRHDLPEPEGELIVSVRATSVNPVDVFVAAGFLREFATHEFPVVLGRDFAGVTAAGEEVFGFVPIMGPNVHRGAWAERIAVDGFIAPKPSSLSMAEAGAAALAGVTALLCVEALELSAGERVLIVGATGGVGAFAVQLCAAAGATVIAPGHEHDVAYLKGLGAAEVPERGTLPSGVDALIDLVARDARHAGALREGGRAVSPLQGPGTAVRAESDPNGPARLGAKIDELALRVPLCEGFSFGEIASALSAMGDHKQGKLSIV